MAMMTVTDFEHPQASQLRQTYAFPVSKIIKIIIIFCCFQNDEFLVPGIDLLAPDSFFLVPGNELLAPDIFGYQITLTGTER